MSYECDVGFIYCRPSLTSPDRSVDTCHACVPSVSHGAISVFSLPIATGSGLRHAGQTSRSKITGMRPCIGARMAFARVAGMMAQVSRFCCRHPTYFPDPCKRHWHAVDEQNIERRFGLLARNNAPFIKARGRNQARCQWNTCGKHIQNRLHSVRQMPARLMLHLSQTTANNAQHADKVFHTTGQQFCLRFIGFGRTQQRQCFV